jgi:hypothetical protein
MSNALDRIAKHADKLDALANDLQADGIGGHATRGHQAVLRSLASAMRLDGANGKVPHEFINPNPMYGSASVPQLPAQILKTLSAAGLPSEGTISVAAFDEKTIAANISPHERLQTKLQLDRLGRLIA